MSDNQVVREMLQLFAESLEGGPARRLPYAGWFSPKFGGPEQVARIFRPVSADPAVAEEFRRAHEAGMRAEVLNSVLRALATLDRPDHELEQADIDARFVALGHLTRFIHDQVESPFAQQLFEHALALQDELATAWLRPYIDAKLNTPD